MKLVVIAAIALLGTACERQKASDLGAGEAVEITVVGLRSVIDRSVSVGEQRVLVAGKAGHDLEARLIWANRDGSIVHNMPLPGIVRAAAVESCVDGERGGAIFLHGDDSAQTTTVVVNDTGVERSSTQHTTDVGHISIRAVGGPASRCGFCVAQAVDGTLTCQFDIANPAVSSWNTGLLGQWIAIQTDEKLVVADWRVGDEGWITVRMGDAEFGEAGGFQWRLGYIVGRLPDFTEEGLREELRPHLVAEDDHIEVVFVDGTEYYTRLFVQAFPFDATEPDEAAHLEGCQGTCDILWAGRESGATWVWYREGHINWAERLGSGSERQRGRFFPPSNAQPLGNGFFKMGLGDLLGNWPAVLVAMENIDEEEETE
jgi:hypothetical protein